MSARDDESLSPAAREAIAALEASTRRPLGAADVVPAAEAAIDRGASLRAVTKSLGKPSAAAAYLTHSLARRHSIAAAGESCAGCGAATGGIVGVRWRFSVPARFFRGALGERAASETVETHHALCAACAGRPLRVGRRAAWFGLAAIVPAVAGIGALVAGYRRIDGPGTEAAAQRAFLVGSVAIFVTIALVFVSRACGRSSVPRGIRRAVPRWLRFDAWQGWFDRSAR